MSSRSLPIQIFFIAASLLLAGKAMYLQLIDSTYAQRAQATAIEDLPRYPSRGLIYDRNGKLLINNNPVFDLMVTYNQVRQMDTARFCSLLGIDQQEFVTRLEKDWRDKRYNKRKPYVFMNSLSATTFARLNEHLYEFPGFFVQARTVRGYPQPFAAHVLGFIREVDKKEIETSAGEYVLGDYIGGSGLEKAYETQIKGAKGVQYLVKDNLGRFVESYQNGELDIAPVAGQDIVTTIDIETQAYAEQLLQGKIGAIVAIEPKTGEILAMVSSPSYDPNLLAIHRERGQAVAALSQDSLKPFFNRAVQAKYPPGSTFKALVALIALQEGVITEDYGLSCPGFYAYGGHSWGCRNHPAPRDIKTAIQYSCNTYFFSTFRKIVDKWGFYNPQIGLDTFAHYLHQFGLGSAICADFTGEAAGNIPNSKTYDQMYPKEKGSWKSPTIISLGIGQGEMQLTTVQMANVIATIANRGYYYPPHLGKLILKSKDEAVPLEFEKKTVDIEARHFQSVIDGLIAVVSSGTGRASQVPGVIVAGKTGTVQNPHGEDHSTFIAFAPADDPQIAIAVYVENGGGGGKFAAPIAGLIMEQYLKREITDPLRLDLEKRIRETNLIAKP